MAPKSMKAVLAERLKGNPIGGAAVAALGVRRHRTGGLATGQDGQYQSPEAYVPSADFQYDKLKPLLANFREAVLRAITQDRIEFTLLTTLGSTVHPLSIPFLLSIRQRHELVVAEAQAALIGFERAMLALAPLAPLPRNLQDQARRWDSLARRLTERANQVKQWQSIPGWSGASAEEYRAAAITQANAVAELAGIFSSAGKSAMSAAALNMAAFSDIARTTVRFTTLIQQAPRLTQAFEFIRTKTAKGYAEDVTKVLNQMVLLNRVRATSLTTQIVFTVNTPALLQEGTWPSGTAGAEVAPVDLSRSIEPDPYYDYIK